MNHLRELGELHNRYFGMRHGESQVVMQPVAVSSAASGLDAKSLTDTGREQVRQSVSQHKDVLDHQTVIYSSDFLRCRQTAEVVAAELKAAPPQFTPALRERNFGRELGQARSEESVEQVTDRLTQLIVGLERQYQGQTVLLVSHGDVLPILFSAFTELQPTDRQEPSLRPAEILALN